MTGASTVQPRETTFAIASAVVYGPRLSAWKMVCGTAKISHTATAVSVRLRRPRTAATIISTPRPTNSAPTSRTRCSS